MPPCVVEPFLFLIHRIACFPRSQLFSVCNFCCCSIIVQVPAWVTDHEFVDFKTKFGKQYSSPLEELRRARIFAKNMAIAKKDNEEAGGEAIFGATKFSDLTAAEFKSQYLTYRRSDRQFRGSPFAEVVQPSAVTLTVILT